MTCLLINLSFFFQVAHVVFFIVMLVKNSIFPLTSQLTVSLWAGALFAMRARREIFHEIPINLASDCLRGSSLFCTFYGNTWYKKSTCLHIYNIQQMCERSWEMIHDFMTGDISFYFNFFSSYNNILFIFHVQGKFVKKYMSDGEVKYMVQSIRNFVCPVSQKSVWT